MKELLAQTKIDIENVVTEWLETNYLKKDELFIVGCSTSEVLGTKIGSSGSEEVAEVIFSGLERLSKEKQIHLAFQCCEHVNRAIVLERSVQEKFTLDEVYVTPVPSAGGSMASYAFNHFKDAIVVEEVTAHAGIDIGDTMIGMHLKKVAVPLRLKQTRIGNAHFTAARTRPKLIGGARAQYPQYISDK